MNKILSILAGLGGLAFLLARNIVDTDISSVTSAIKALAETAEDSNFDSSRVDCCKKIFDICKSNKATDLEVSYAIDKMRQIARLCTLDSSKRTISDLITKLIFEEE